MAFVPLPHGALCVVRFSGGDMIFTNGFYFVKQNFSESDQDALADTVDTRFGAPMKTIMSNECAYEVTTCYDMRTSTGRVVQNADGAGTGTQTDDSLPLMSAMVVTLRTAERGRSARGRLYIGGLGEANFDGGQYSLAAKNAVLGNLSVLKSYALDLGWTWVVASRQQDGVPLTAMVGRPITSQEMRNYRPGSQRRRVDRP